MPRTIPRHAPPSSRRYALLPLLLAPAACDGTGPAHGGIAGNDLRLSAQAADSTATRSYQCSGAAYLRLYPPLADTTVEGDGRFRRDLVRLNQGQVSRDSALQPLSVRVRRIGVDSIELVLGGGLNDTLRGRARRGDPATFKGDWSCDAGFPLAADSSLAEAGYPSDRAIEGMWWLEPIRPVE